MVDSASNPSTSADSMILQTGPATLPVVEARGLAYDIGLSIGRQTRDGIRHHLAAFDVQARVGTAGWRARRDRLMRAMQRHAPQSLAELRGMADGAAVAIDALLWLNTEPAYGQPSGGQEASSSCGADQPLADDRCTNVVFAQGPDGPIWGKNNDRPAAEPARPVLAKVVQRVGQLPVVAFTYAGLLCTGDAMNAAGLCVGHSSVGSVYAQSDDHVPIRVWVHEGLHTCRTSAEFVAHMQAMPLRGKGYAIVCVDALGDAVAIEAPCPLLQVRHATHPAGHLHAVNLYQLPALAQSDRRTPAGKCNAQARRDWLDANLPALDTTQAARADLAHMQAILRHDQPPGAICRRAVAPDTSMTEYSMIGLPARRQVMCLYGDPGRQDYQTLTFRQPVEVDQASQAYVSQARVSQVHLSQAQVSPRADDAPSRASFPGTLSAEALRESMRLACGWIQDVAQLATDDLPADTDNRMGFAYTRWRGAIRGEYHAATGRWDFFCPVWHTGQAVKALTLASQAMGDASYLRGALAGRDFLLNHQVWDQADPNHGLLLAFEDEPQEVNTSAVLEAMDGLLILADHQQDDALRQRVVAMGDFLLRRMYMPGLGVFRDLYHPGRRELGDPLRFRSKANIGGRPLLDDGILLKLHTITGKARYLNAHLEIAHRLVADQNPAGNWLDYGPCNPVTGRFHPRHTYWWGLPMIDTYLHTGEASFLHTAIAAGHFTLDALRADGGYMRGVALGFKTDSFGHATSGSACAAILFMRLFEVTGDAHWLPSAERALRFCMDVQFTHAADANLQGSILEKVLPPDGSDKLPYHLRDLGTIFFVSAGALYLKLAQASERSQPAHAQQRSGQA